MNVKYTSTILLGLFGSVLCSVSEEDVQKWLDDIIDEYGEDCKDKISDDNFQQMKEDIEADNGEIRDYKHCLAVHCKYIEDKEIDTKKMMDDFSPHAENMEATDEKNVKKMMANCKEEGEQEENEIDIFGKFSACMIDRCKTGL